MVELMALEQCLEILIESNLYNTIIEADSEFTINLVNIGNDTILEKLSNHWWILQVYQHIQSHLIALRTLIFVHVPEQTIG